MLVHDILKHGPRDFECRVCGKAWQRRPQAACSGVKVYDSDDCGPFLTRKELADLGYQTAAYSMPPEVGCYYSHAAGRYVYLYDPIHVTPKMRRHGVPHAVTHILWPLNCTPLLDTLYDMEAQRVMFPMDNEKTTQLRNEVANIAALTNVFTRIEMEHMTGAIIAFKIPPTVLSRFYPTQRPNRHEEHKLLSNLLIAYRKHITLSQPLP